MRRLPSLEWIELGRASELDPVFQTGTIVTGRFGVVRYAETDGAGRVAVVAGKRLGKAVLRNRLRRRWREVVRLGPRIRAGLIVVVVVRGRTERATHAQLVSEWARIMGGADLLER